MKLPDSWDDACAALDAMSDDAVRARIADIELALAGRNDLERSPTTRWTARLETEGVEPRLLACRVLGVAADNFDRALASTDVAQIRTLALVGPLDARRVPALVARLTRMQVTHLQVRGELGAGVQPLFQVPKLVALDAGSCGLGRGELAKVVDGFASITPRDLRLGLNDLVARDAADIVRLIGLAPVRRLALGGNKLQGDGVETLMTGPVGSLETLDLEGTYAQLAGVEAIARASLARLGSLSLMGCDIGDAGARTLATAPSLVGLHTLDLRSNMITAAGVSAVLGSATLRGLRRIDFTLNEIGDEVVEVLAKSSAVARLNGLTIDDSYLSDEARDSLEHLHPGVVEIYRVRDW